MKNKLLIRGIAFLAVTALGIGCSDQFEEPAGPSGLTVLAVADANNDLDIFTAALVKTNLAKSLNNLNSGEYTVFAPNDSAFIGYFKTLAIPNVATFGEPEVLAYIKNEMNTSSVLTIASLAARLNYCMVSSKIASSSITTGNAFTTINGARLSLSKSGSFIYLNAISRVATTDLEASNGLIHIIKNVASLTPLGTTGATNSTLAFLGYTSTSSPAVSPIAYTTNPPTINGGTTTDAVDDYDLFSVALRKTGVCLTLFPNTSPLPDFTVFAPKDVILRNYLAAKWSVVLADEPATQTFINSLKDADPTANPPVVATNPTLTEFTEFVKKHIVQGRVLTTDLSNGTLTTIGTNASLTVTVNGATITLGGTTSSSDLISKNNLTNAGVVHGISAVID